MREQGLRHGVHTIAVHRRLSLESHRAGLQQHLGADAADAGGDLRNGDKCSYVDDFGAGEYEYWPVLPADLCDPNLSTRHSSLHASAWDQNASDFSGFR